MRRKVSGYFFLPPHIVGGIKSSALLLAYKHLLHNDHISKVYKFCCRSYFKIKNICIKPSVNFEDSARKVNSKLPYMKPYTIINEYTVMVLGCNPGSYTLQGTNTYLIGKHNCALDNLEMNSQENLTQCEGNVCNNASENTSAFSVQCVNLGKILIDTGEGIFDHITSAGPTACETYVSLLLDDVFPRTGTTHLSAILLTHYHYDHMGGVEMLLRGLESRGMLPLPTVYKRKCALVDKVNTKIDSFSSLENHQSFALEYPRSIDVQVKNQNRIELTTLYTSGHTSDHVAFLLSSKHPVPNGEPALLSGDCILGCGTSVFQDLYAYMNSLYALRLLCVRGYDKTNSGTFEHTPNLVDCVECSESHNVDQFLKIKHIFPGHGCLLMNSALETVDNYIHHRELREQQIVKLLTTKKNYLSSWDITSCIYDQNLSYMVMLSAHNNTYKHLLKLKENKVVVHEAGLDLWKII